MNYEIFAFFGIIIGILFIFAETQGKKIVGVFASLLLLLLAVLVLADGLMFPTSTVEYSDCCGGCGIGGCSNTSCRMTSDCCAGMACNTTAGICTNECSAVGAACYSQFECCSPMSCEGGDLSKQLPGNCTLPTASSLLYTTNITTVYTAPVLTGLPAAFTFSSLIALVLGLLGMFGLLYYSIAIKEDINGGKRE